MSDGGPVDPGELRVSDGEREAVAQMLARAMVAGQITPVEYSDRAAIAQGATVRRELEGLLSDLPGAVLHASLAVDVLELEAGVGGTITRRGYWKVPPTVRVRSWIGGVELDFSEAETATPVVAVELATGMCSPVIVLPEGGTVDVDELRISAGSVRDETVHRRERGTPHLMVRGRHSFGDVVLRHPRRTRLERWAPTTRLERLATRRAQRVRGPGRSGRTDGTPGRGRDS